ncbi:MAG: hypothetical protein ACR2HX_22835 [Pyrinomonadaceae bacterium]
MPTHDPEQFRETLYGVSRSDNKGRPGRGVCETGVFYPQITQIMQTKICEEQGTHRSAIVSRLRLLL